MSSRVRPDPGDPQATASPPPEDAADVASVPLPRLQDATREQIEEELRVLARVRAEAREAEADVTAKLVTMVHKGHDKSVSLNRLAALSGVQRPQARAWLAKPNPNMDRRRWGERTLVSLAEARGQAREVVEEATQALIDKVRVAAGLGMTQSRIAQVCTLDPSTIRTWLGLREHNPS